MATEAIRRIRQVFSVEGADAVVAANQRVAQSQQGIVATSTSTERATLSLDRQFGSIERRYNATVRAQQDYERVQRQVNAAVAQNPALTQRAAVVLDEVNKRYQAQVAAARGAASANDNVAKSTGLARYEMINLSRQVQDIGVSLAGGQSPFTVLVQQGSQVGDIFANTTGTLRGFASQIAAMITPTRVLGAGVLALGAAAYAGYSYWKSYALVLDDLSKATGTATSDLSALQSAASVKGIDQNDFAAGIKSFSQAVYEAKAGANDLYKLFRLNGQAVGDTATSLERVADLVMRARDDQQRLNILREAGLPSTMEWVRLTRDGADGLRRAKEEAAKFGGAVNDEMVAKAREFDEAWNRAWTNFAVSARAAVTDSVSWIDGLIMKGREAVAAFDRATGGRGLPTVGGNLLKSGFGTPLSQNVLDLYRGFENVRPASAGTGATRDTTDLAAQQRDLQLTQQRISLLGDLASVTEMVAAKEKELAILRDQGARITAEEAKRITELYRAQLEYSRASERIGTLGAAATDAERYGLTLQGLALKLKENKISQDDFNRAAREASPIFQTLRNTAVDFTQDLVSGLMRGQSLMDALASSATSLGSSLLNSGIQNLATGNFTTGLLQTGIGAVASWFGLDSSKKKAQEQAAQQAAQAAQQAAEEARRKAEQQAETAANYRYQAASLGIDTASYAGAFAKLELDIQRERAEAAKVGGEAITAYEQLAQAKRYALEKEWQDKIAALRLSYEDRIFAALNDTSTLAGKLAEYDRKAAQERADAIKTYGQVYVELEQAQALERGKIIKDAMREQTDYYDNLRRSITDFTNGLSFGSLSALSPAEQYLAARNQFQEQYQLALSGDRTAQGGITGVAQTLLEQARNYLGPSAQYGDLVSRITAQLGALPDLAMAADPQVQELQRLGGDYFSPMTDYLAQIAVNTAPYGSSMSAAIPATNIPATQSPVVVVAGNDNVITELRGIVAELKGQGEKMPALINWLIRLIADGNGKTDEVQAILQGLRSDVRFKSAESVLRNAS